MKFGVFFQLPCGPGQSPVQRYRDTLEQIVLAEELGFDTAWLAELHFLSSFSIMPSPLMVAAAAAQLTSRIRFGIGVNLLPVNHPLRLAEDGATADILTGGRLEFGIGRGTELAHSGFGVAQEDSKGRLVEALEILRLAWTQERFSFEGRYWSIPDLELTPKPLQRPQPPLRLACNSEDTFPLAGKLGLPALAWILINPLNKLVERVSDYRRALVAHGHQGVKDDLALAVPLFVSDSSEEAQALPRASVLNYVAAVSRISPSRSLYAGLTYDDVLRDAAIYRNPAGCVERLRQIEDALDLSHCICWFNVGGLIPHDEVMRSMRLFAEEVAPSFR